MTYIRIAARAAQLSTLVLAISLSGCQGRSSDASASKSQGGTAFKVALLTPGPISDQSWNAGAYAGLTAIRDSLGATVSHIQTRTPTEFDENFRLYGEQGYKVVFGHGFEYQDAAARVAPTHPNTIYITTGGNRAGANIASLEFAFEDGSYLAGMMAAAVSTSNTIGAIGGTEIPPVRRSFEAFTRGAKSVKPSITVLTSYIGNWEDVSAAKEQALAQIARGADVIFQNADAAGLGIFQATKESRGVRAIGSNSNQNDIVPDVILGSVVIKLPQAFLLAAREVQSGAFTPRVVSYGLRSGVVDLVLNERLAATIPAAARAAMDSVRSQIMAGAFSAQSPASTATSAP
jgi:basic membrane protein A and related proteins